MTHDEAVSVVAMLGAAYPSQRLTDDTAQLWVRSLSGIAFEPASEAAVDWIEHELYYPTIAAFGVYLNRHKRPDQREIPPETTRAIPVAEGRVIAADAYEAECRRLGKPMNPTTLERIRNLPIPEPEVQP